MKMPRSRFRRTSYHIVDASSVARISSQGRGGDLIVVAIPASIN